MGGDSLFLLNSTIDDDDDDTEIPTLLPGGLSGEMTGETDSGIRESDGRSFIESLDIETNGKCVNSVYAQLIKSYDDFKYRVENMEVSKSKILSYTPGSWVENVGGMILSDYNVPKTTTILLIGPKGSGKSSLVNRISRVFEDDKFAPERAQVAYKWNGTSFLQEYMMPRNSTSFCFYDTPGFSNDLSENLEMIKQWLTKGVRHGEMVQSASGNSTLRARRNYERRRVDFVVLVVNGLSVLKCMERNGADTQYMHKVAKVFNSPFLSFKDHKPVIVITHGDLLSISERACVRVYLGDLLGVHPSKQTFDIPDNCELTTELTIVDLVRYSLEHADRNLPCKSQPRISKGSTIILLWTHLLLLLAVVIFMFTAHIHGFRSLQLHQERVDKPSLEIKKVTEIDPGIVSEHILEMQKGSNTKPSKKTKKSDTKKTPGKNKKMKNVHVPEPILEIDWKMIRHIW